VSESEYTAWPELDGVEEGDGFVTEATLYYFDSASEKECVDNNATECADNIAVQMLNTNVHCPRKDTNRDHIQSAHKVSSQGLEASADVVEAADVAGITPIGSAAAATNKN
jgi:hypothetical protein